MNSTSAWNAKSKVAGVLVRQQKTQKAMSQVVKNTHMKAAVGQRKCLKAVFGAT